jgi:hypothetical protein
MKLYGSCVKMRSLCEGSKSCDGARLCEVANLCEGEISFKMHDAIFAELDIVFV